MAITRDEFLYKVEALKAFIIGNNHDGLIIKKQPNFSWLCGGRGFIGLASEMACGQFIVSRDRTCLLVNNIEAPRLEAEEIGDLPVEVRTFDWHQGDALALKEITGSRTFVTDDQCAPQMRTLRSVLGSREQERYRKLGKNAALIVEAFCKEQIKPGMSEFDIAGALSSRFWSAGMEPITLLIAADDRAFKYRHPVPTGNILKTYCMIVVCVRQGGLIASLTRLVHFGPPAEELIRKVTAAASVDAAFIGSTRPGAKVGDIFTAAMNTYRNTGFDGEWQHHHQGGLTGYMAREYIATPQSTEVVALNQAFAWNPTVAGTKCEDTILIGENGNEIITETGGYSYIESPFEGRTIRRPGLLVR